MRELLQDVPFPIPLATYPPAAADSLIGVLRSRIEIDPFNAVATAIFLLAVVHTFFAARFVEAAHRIQRRSDAQAAVAGVAPMPSVAAEFLHFFGEVEVSATFTSYKKRIVTMTGQICSRPEIRPQGWVCQQLIVSHGEFLQFSPFNFFSFNEANRLGCFKHSIIIKISETCFPGPGTSGETKLFSVVFKWSNAIFHLIKFTGIDEYEMTFLERILCSNIAYVYVE
jgi:hypothetical protein